jgi:hypothetical protein
MTRVQQETDATRSEAPAERGHEEILLVATGIWTQPYSRSTGSDSNDLANCEPCFCTCEPFASFGVKQQARIGEREGREGKGREGRRAAVVCGPRCHASGYCAESRKSRENVARLLPPFPLPLPLLSLPPSRLQLRFFGRHTARQKADETSKWPRMGTERPATGRHGLVGRTRWTRRRR